MPDGRRSEADIGRLQQREADRPRDHPARKSGIGGPGDPEPFETERAGDQDRIEDPVGHRHGDQDRHRALGRTLRPQGAVQSHHEGQREETQRIGGHVGVDQRQQVGLRLQQFEQRLPQQVERDRQHHPHTARKQESEIGEPARMVVIAPAQCAAHHRGDPRHHAHAEAGKCLRDREDEGDRRQLRRAELADEIGVDDPDRHDCRDPDDHRRGLRHEMAADRTACQSGIGRAALIVGRCGGIAGGHGGSLSSRSGAA